MTVGHPTHPFPRALTVEIPKPETTMTTTELSTYNLRLTPQRIASRQRQKTVAEAFAKRIAALEIQVEKAEIQRRTLQDFINTIRARHDLPPL